MRQSPMLEYSLDEFQNRLSDAAKKIGESGLDFLMGSSKGIVCHLTGLRSVAWKSKLSTPGLIFIDKSGSWGVVGSYSALDTAMYTTCLEKDDFYFFDASGRFGVALNYLDALTYALNDLEFTSGKMGCELSGGIHLHMDLGLFESLKSRFPELTFVDATDVIWDILAVKSKKQIEHLKDADKINGLAVRAGMSKLTPGKTTEMELYKAIAREGYLQGAEHFTYMSVLAGAKRSLCADCPASENEIISSDPGTIVRIEGGAIRRELNAPFTHNIVIGGVQQDQKPAFEICSGMLDAAQKTIKPGITAGEIAAAMDEYISSKNKKNWNVFPGFAGSGIGWGRQDGPLLVKDSDEVIKAGMVLSLVAGVREDSVGELLMRQNVVVSDTGCEYLYEKTVPLIM